MKDMQDQDVVVIGGGLAAMASAAELARQGLRCMALTGEMPGGLLLSIESVAGLQEHPEGIAGYDICPMSQEAAEEAGAELVSADANRLSRDGSAWVVNSPSGAVRARAVVLACGARLRTLGVPGEERLAGRGVSHCASCDGPLLRGKPVAVVGGGDAACQEALTLAQHAGVVHLLVRGPALRAREAWRQRVAAQPKIEVRYGTQVTSIDGEHAVESLRLSDGSHLPVQAVFVFAGLVPNTEWLDGIAALDATGCVAVDAALGGSAPGLFAAGVVRSGHSGQAADALADGVAVARTVQAYLSQ